MFANFYGTGQYRALSGTFTSAYEMRDTANLTFSFFCKFSSERRQESLFIATVYC